jgi:DNA polymerase III epsilon subunit-like protein
MSIVQTLVSAFKMMDEEGDVSLMREVMKSTIPGRIDIFLDTETSGLSKYDKVIQLAYVVMYYEEVGSSTIGHELFTVCDLINVHCTINPAAAKVHGITLKKLRECGEDKDAVYSRLLTACNLSRKTDGRVIAFNAAFDKRMMGDAFDGYKWECAMKTFKGLGESGKMSVIYERTFDEALVGAHDALVDVRGMIRLWEYFECHA